MSRFNNVPITQPMIDKARSMCTGSEFNAHTHKEHGAGQFVGNLGEIAFKRWLDFHFIEHEWLGSEKHYYDFVVASRKIDIKSKERTVVTTERHHFMVETRIKNVDCDYYVGVSVQIIAGEEDPKSIQLLGWISKAEFWSIPKDEDGFEDRFECHKIFHSRLHSMDELLNRITARLYKIAFGEVSNG
jgi:hypothetical protein